MTNKKSILIISALSAIADRIVDAVERFLNWLVNTRIIKRLDSLADWTRKFLAVAKLVRFSFWISVLGSAALFATSQSMEILRVIAEDSEHRFRALSLFTISALALSLMSWYWARVLIYRFEPDKLDLPKRDPEAIAARWMPRVCGLIPFVGIGYALWHAAKGLDPGDDARTGLLILLSLDLAEGLMVGVGLYFRHKVAKRLRARFPTLWPEKVKSKGATGLTDLPTITWVVLLSTVIFSVVLFILFNTSTGQIRVAGWFGSASLVLFSVAAWIAFGSFFVVYFGQLIRLPILTPLLFLAFLFSYFDLNDNHEIRSFNCPIQNEPMDFNDRFQKWLELRKDKSSYKDRPYPVFIITAEGGGITTGYFTATVLTAIQDRAPNFAQHVFVISGVSGGSIGTAVYAGFAKRCARNVATADLPGKDVPSSGNAGKLQQSADLILKDDYLSPLLSAFLYPDLLQRFLPLPINRWDRARALEERLEISWKENATCDGTTASGQSELSLPFYDFFSGFPQDATPAIFFNTTNVETGERMFVTNLLPHDPRFDTLPALADVNSGLNLPFSSAACLSGRFPVVTPAGFVRADSRKFRYVDGGYYENSGAATAFNILMSLRVKDENAKDEIYLYDALLKRDKTDLYKALGKLEMPMGIVPVIIRIGFRVPKLRNAKDEINDPSSEERAKYKDQGLNEISSPVKTLLNTRGARGNDAVRQLETAIRNLKIASGADPKECAVGCIFDVILDEGKGRKLPLGWTLSFKPRCEMQQQVDSVIDPCKKNTRTDPDSANQQIQKIIALLAPKP
jgi:hypothetical protein